jgi:antitoxin component YwqK of YwqJK toxin-antitoxin module
MRRLLIFTLTIFFSTNCGEKTEKVIKEKYPDGSPKAVEYYKESDGQKVLTKQNTFYQDKKLRSEGNIKNNKMEGKWTFYYNNGKKWSEGFFKDGIEDGLHTTWYENGNKRYEGLFKNGKRIGIWTIWDESGKIIKEINN